MDIKEIQELAKAAAHSALLASSDKHTYSSRTEYVDEFLNLYEYAMTQLRQKQHQAQSQLPPEFRTENHTRFR